MSKNTIVYISTYPPRECGIATFTKDLADYIKKRYGNLTRNKVIAMQEDGKIRNYPKEVIATINENKIEDYIKAADLINSMKNVLAVNIQHEFGIFGGIYGEYLLETMKRINKKIITTFHTVLENPDPKMKDIVLEIAKKSAKIVVITNAAKEILKKDYGIEENKIEVIYHGTPNINIIKNRDRVRKKINVEKKKLLLTFGMLSRGKSLETTIKAIPIVIQKHPEVVYFILGETHPRVKAYEGESYREELENIVKELNLQDKVFFVNKYLKLKEIIDYLKAADIYLAPALDYRQVSSGTVSYAMAAGKATVASSTKYNEEMLANNRGVVVEENKPERFAEEIIKILDDYAYKDSLEKTTFEFSRKMTWDNVANQYYKILLCKNKNNYFGKLPKIKYDHFYEMVDDFAMLQFCDYCKPLKHSGYTLDDNSRALVVAIKTKELGKNKKMDEIIKKVLAFIEFCQREDGYFHNVVNEKREFLDEFGSEDSFGRTIYALSKLLESTEIDEDTKLIGKKILSKSLTKVNEIKSPRAQAHILKGLVKIKDLFDVEDKIENIVFCLLSKFKENSEEDWKWFESYLTYSNAIIPNSLLEVGHIKKNKKVLSVGKQALDFLTRTHFEDDFLMPVGQDGWFLKGQKKAKYDQQPIEAAEMTKVYIKAFEVFNKEYYLKKARISFDWFLGRNSLGIMVYDESTGGCFDGITSRGVNVNQGAESTLVYLESRICLEKALRRFAASQSNKT